MGVFPFEMEILKNHLTFYSICAIMEKQTFCNKKKRRNEDEVVEKVLAAATAGMLCLGSVGASGVQSVLESVGHALIVHAEESVANDSTLVSTGTTTVRVGTRTTELTYSVYDDDTVEIVDCEEDAVGDLEIPAEIDDKVVTSIGDDAFSQCVSLTNVIIPDSVISIGERSFSHCAGLTEINIPDSVTHIGKAAFENCTNLLEIIIPVGITRIEGWVFSHCSSLTKITIPDSVTSIGGCAFSDCYKLESVTIPDSVTTIGASAFFFVVV